MTAKILAFPGESEVPAEISGGVGTEITDPNEKELSDSRRAVIDKLQLEILERGEPPTYEITQETERIRGILKSVWWKSFEETGKFNLSESIGNLAGALEMDPEVVRGCIIEAVSPDCLSKVSMDEEGKDRRPLIENLSENNFEVYCLLRALKEEGTEMFVWTLGDEDWQREKFRRSGAGDFIDSRHLFVSEGVEKTEKLREILEKILSEKINRPVHVYVVDDNLERIAEAISLSGEYAKKGIILHDYHFKLQDKEADGTAFYKYIISERSVHPDLVLVLDFDGVIADTDGALFGKAVINIIKEKIRSRISSAPTGEVSHKTAA
jgi:hypothetical protein